MKLIKISADRVQIKSDSEELRGLRLNDLLLVADGVSGLVCVVTGINTHEMSGVFTLESEEVSLIGDSTVDCDIIGSVSGGNLTKTVDVYPSTNVAIRRVPGEYLQTPVSGEAGFRAGEYAGYGVPALIDGNKLFRRHFAVLGNTGSGKSYAISMMLEKLAALKSSNVILFDVHGEYSGLPCSKTIRMGNDNGDAAFPYWFLPLRDLYSNLLKLKEESATLQAAALRRAFYRLRGKDSGEDTPICYDIRALLCDLLAQNSEEVGTGEYYKSGERAGQEKTVKGENNGKLSSLIALLEDKMLDSRYAFMFKAMPQSYLFDFISAVYDTDESAVKVIDLSGLPHDMIPVVIAVITKLIYAIQLKYPREAIRPLAIVCEEAHVYIPSDDFGLSASQRRLLEIFEIIAKEGRKFGVTLCVSSQRPRELNRTIMAQCANFIVLKMNNEADKSMIAGVLPESGRGAVDALALFAPGDCLIIGDCTPVTLKVRLDMPACPPRSNTIDVWDVWNKDAEGYLCSRELVESLLKG